MKKELFAVLCAVGLLLWGVGTASAATVTWTMLLHSSVAGAGPGADVLIGTTDDTTSGEKNTCNYSQDGDCDTGATPARGTYNFAAIEFDDAVENACGLGDLSGQACVCAEPEGADCDVDEDCESSGCGGPTCCPGANPLLGCVQCEDVAGFDTYTYFGDGVRDGTFTVSQSGTSGSIETFQAGTTPSISGISGACLLLHDDGGTVPTCGVGPFTDGEINIVTHTLQCEGKLSLTADILDIAFDGDIIKLDELPETTNCGYTPADLALIADAADDASGSTAQYLIVLCGQTDMPSDEPTPCLRDGVAVFRTVAWTAGDATEDCGGP